MLYTERLNGVSGSYKHISFQIDYYQVFYSSTGLKLSLNNLWGKFNSWQKYKQTNKINLLRFRYNSIVMTLDILSILYIINGTRHHHHFTNSKLVFKFHSIFHHSLNNQEPTQILLLFLMGSCIEVFWTEIQINLLILTFIYAKECNCSWKTITTNNIKKHKTQIWKSTFLHAHTIKWIQKIFQFPIKPSASL